MTVDTNGKIVVQGTDKCTDCRNKDRGEGKCSLLANIRQTYSKNVVLTITTCTDYVLEP